MLKIHGIGTIRSHKTISCRIYGSWVLRTEDGWAGLDPAVEGVFKPLRPKVFRLESVGHREPSQKLKFIQITVFGFFLGGERFVLATV